MLFRDLSILRIYTLTLKNCKKSIVYDQEFFAFGLWERVDMMSSNKTANFHVIVVTSKCQPLLVCFQAETAESRDEDTSALLKGSWYSATDRINPAP